MSQMLALLLIVLILYIGDAVSVRTKAWIPSVFVCAVLFLVGYWTFFPKDIVSLAGITTPVAVMMMYLLITNMGTLLSLRELARQWKTILISLAGIAGIASAVFATCIILFDLNTAIVTIPPLVGGIVSAIIMSKGAADAGLVDLSVFAILIYVMQGFAGYPLTAIMLQREGKRVLTKYRSGEWHDTAQNTAASDKHEPTTVVSDEKMPSMFSKIPSHYNTSYFKFVRLAFISYLAYLASSITAPYVSISPFVLCLLFGVIAASFGFLERHSLQKANGFGFAVMVLMLFIFDTLNRATPEMLLRLLFPMVVLIGVAIVGMFLVSWVVGKILGVSMEMAFAISLTALYGFPADYIITNEAINALTKDEKERQLLTNHMLGPMLVGGFISVTMVSVVLAGIMVGYIAPIAG
ncbi:hypothetical protein [Pragia fontium]|uniref:Na+/glutamate symporter n=2 Tax=Pragia fontium TaxID=82985 RepID=A0AAJ4W839_9GAMM|nr:hypothetical protein [Pragia fontium]AKJ41205.1 membrane protein [Pragia fontium]SFC10100.1 hypothetical protein SAMN02745723_101388 [Pragia fontium DSM 5563 = ATCC 49100]SUB81416.1 Uncharacterised protein [Pragia fontium]VEJ53667.1 Uncharacterised protein [Pragia fontium]GKX62732.1 membrane protein [Pragia fontium]